MCGIAGLFLPRNAALIEADTAAMVSVMRHRGPDGEKFHVSDDHRFQAGFARLAIIDLETGEQPIVEDGGRRVLMGNGEIYNYRELRKIENGYPYLTAGDMEVILPLAARHGDDFLTHLNGIYGLALYRRDDHRLLLARDRLGVKPVYWTRLSGGGVLFASEIKALFASGLVSAEIDEVSVSSYLGHGYVPAPNTLFKNIRKLPPGHFMTVDHDGSISIKRYWQAGPDHDIPKAVPEIERYMLDILADSVRLQLRSDVELGALLSGGLDSGLIVALASKQLDRPLNTYTVSFEGSPVDEAPLAKMVAERYSTNHASLKLPSGSVADYLPRLAWFCDEPLNDAALLPNFLIEEVLGKHVTVALNGTGGDEIFAGYGRYFQMPIEARYLGIPGSVRRGLIEPMAGMVSPMTAWQLRRSGKFTTDGGGYLHDHCCHFPPPIRELIGNHQPLPIPAQAGFYDEYDGPSQSAALYADINTYLPDDLLNLLDRTSMAVSVEGRVPFLDHRLVEAGLAVPPEIRTPGGTQKGLERSIAARLLPQAVTDAPKQGFASPVPAWVRAGLGPLARRLLCRPETLDRGWWTSNGIDRLLADPDRHGFRVYSLLMLELAVRMHVEAPVRSSPPSESLQDLADAA